MTAIQQLASKVAEQLVAQALEALVHGPVTITIDAVAERKALPPKPKHRLKAAARRLAKAAKAEKPAGLPPVKTGRPSKADLVPCVRCQHVRRKHWENGACGVEDCVCKEFYE